MQIVVELINNFTAFEKRYTCMYNTSQNITTSKLFIFDDGLSIRNICNQQIRVYCHIIHLSQRKFVESIMLSMESMRYCVGDFHVGMHILVTSCLLLYSVYYRCVRQKFIKSVFVSIPLLSIRHQKIFVFLYMKHYRRCMFSIGWKNYRNLMATKKG